MRPQTPAKNNQKKIRFAIADSSENDYCGVLLTPRALIRSPVPNSRCLRLRTLIQNTSQSKKLKSNDEKNNIFVQLAKKQTKINKQKLQKGCKLLARVQSMLLEFEARAKRLNALNSELQEYQREALNQNSRIQSEEQQLNRVLNQANLNTVNYRKNITNFDYDCIPDINILKKSKNQLKTVSQNRLFTYKNLIQGLNKAQVQNKQRILYFEELCRETITIKSKLKEQENLKNNYQFIRIVLQMQLNPYFQFGFNSQSSRLNEEDQLKLFAKVLKAWNRKEQKTLNLQAIKQYVLLQLYPNWEELLTILPCTYFGYKELFCEQSSSEAALETMIHTQASRRFRIQERESISIVAYFHRLQAFDLWFKELKKQLQSCKNSLLQVRKVTVENQGRLKMKKAEVDCWTMTIEYEAKWIEGKQTRIINLQLLKELNFEALSEAMNKKQGHSLIVKILFETLSNDNIQEELKKIYKMLKKYR